MDGPWHEEHGFSDEVVPHAAAAGEPTRWAICALYRRVALLTAREIQVLELMPSGKSNREIADELVVLDAVKKHVGHILDKSGAANRTPGGRAPGVGMVR